MAIPSKTKYRFRFRVPYTKGKKKPLQRGESCFRLAKGNKEISPESKFGLQAEEGAEISERQIEAARKRISFFTKKFGKVWRIKLFPHNPKTKKPLEVRMGSGKGSIESWVAIAKKGTVIFELSDKVPPEVAKHALTQASYKIPTKCKFIEKKIN